MLPKRLMDECGKCFDVSKQQHEIRGVFIWRQGESETLANPRTRKMVTVGEFLGRPDNQSGSWLIDAGWGGPPGPIRVRWVDGDWVYDGFPPYPN